jgi:glyoxylase-like metal-dependent hydrolase (beta-lactamase superfamily II)
MPDFKTSIGNVEITSLSDGHIEFEKGNFFPSVPEEAWGPYRDDLTPEGRIHMNMGSFLLRSDGRTVLVDTGLGVENSTFDIVSSGKLISDFKAKGIGLDEVDVVVITHLHRDHVGWNITWDDDNYSPTFPNATYWIPRADWDMFTRRTGMAAFAYIREQVTPLENLGVLEIFEGERAITGELTTYPTPGHTPGHASVLVSSQGEKGIVLGDASHLPLQAQETSWSPRADNDPKLSAASRKGIMDSMERDNGLLMGGHYPAPGCGRLVRLQGRRYWKAL